MSGPDGRAVIERALPGAATPLDQDTVTCFDTDIPARLAWALGAEDARRITQAVLQLGGGESGQWFAESASSYLPGCPRPRRWCWPGRPSLALTHPTEITAALVAFLGGHPIPG